MDDDNSIAWFLAGAAIGAAAGILFAPKTGRDTRALVSRTTHDSREALEKSGQELMDKGKELYDRGRKIAEEASELFDRGRKLVQGESQG
jgi:gas vesicle protein